MKKSAILLLLCALSLQAQSNSGEIRLKVTDPSGLGVKTAIHVSSEANQYRAILQTDNQGNLVLQRLPFGLYTLAIEQTGFAPVTETVALASSIPIRHAIQLKLATVTQAIAVNSENTLIDPDQAGSVSQIGSDVIQHRLSSIPGRSLQDLVNSQPGWLYEGNAVLHPRGSEYQTQFVVDGIPLTDNRSSNCWHFLRRLDFSQFRVENLRVIQILFGLFRFASRRLGPRIAAILFGKKGRSGGKLKRDGVRLGGQGKNLSPRWVDPRRSGGRTRSENRICPAPVGCMLLL